VGASNGNTTIHISENSVSSSLLNMLDSHIEGAHESKIIGSEEVPVRALDSNEFERDIVLIGATSVEDRL
jgi:hypothetical protein